MIRSLFFVIGAGTLCILYTRQRVHGRRARRSIRKDIERWEDEGGAIE